MSLRRAISAIKAGDKKTGQQLLAQILKTDPRNEYAWLWMTEVVDRDEDRIRCLRNVLKINPDNDLVKKRLALLEQQEPQSEPDGEAPSASSITLELPKGTLLIDFENERVTLDEEELILSPVELELLDVLARHRGQTVTYEHLLTRVWGVPKEKLAEARPEGIEKYVYFLRRRLEEDPSNPTLIQHEEGVGYRLG